MILFTAIHLFVILGALIASKTLSQNNCLLAISFKVALFILYEGSLFCLDGHPITQQIPIHRMSAKNVYLMLFIMAHYFILSVFEAVPLFILFIVKIYHFLNISISTQATWVVIKPGYSNSVTKKIKNLNSKHLIKTQTLKFFRLLLMCGLLCLDLLLHFKKQHC